MGILSKVRHLVNKNILLMLYYSLIYPFLIYDAMFNLDPILDPSRSIFLDDISGDLVRACAMEHNAIGKKMAT